MRWLITSVCAVYVGLSCAPPPPYQCCARALVPANSTFNGTMPSRAGGEAIQVKVEFGETDAVITFVGDGLYIGEGYVFSTRLP